MNAKVWNIVLVEDHDPDVFLIKEALAAQRIPYGLTHFSDSEKAVRWLCGDASPARVSTPDLILLALNMPRIPGVEVLRRIRETPHLAGVPVAILTSSNSPQDRREAEIAGATGFISKPAMLDDFLEHVGTSVRQLLHETCPETT